MNVAAFSFYVEQHKHNLGNFIWSSMDLLKAYRTQFAQIKPVQASVQNKRIQETTSILFYLFFNCQQQQSKNMSIQPASIPQHSSVLLN